MTNLGYLLVCSCLFFLSLPESFSLNPIIDSLQLVLENDSKSLDTEDKAYLLYELGIEYHYIEAHVEAEKYFQKSLDLAEPAAIDWLISENHYYLGLVNFWQSRYPKSIEHLQKSLDLKPESLTTEDSIYIIDQLGSSYFYMGDLDMALEYRLQSLNLSERVADSNYLAMSLYGLAEIENELKLYDSALKYINQSLSISEKTGDVRSINYCLDFLGDIYHNTDEYEKALEYKSKACETVDVELEEYHLGYCDHNLALTYSKMGNHAKAIELFSSALNRREKSGQYEEAAQSRASLGELIAKQGDCKKGMEMLRQSLKESKRLDLKLVKRDVFQKLYNTAKRCGNFKEAIEYQENYFLLRDSISNEKSQMRIANLNAKQEVNALKLDVLQKNERLSNLYFIMLSGAVVFSALVAIFIFWLYKRQQSNSRRQLEQAAIMAKNNQALESANQQLKAANEELEQYAYVISHDLKAPLRTIGSYASLINRRYKNILDEDGRAFFQYITEDAKHMHSLLEDVLTYSKVSQDDTAKEEVDLNKIKILVPRLLDSAIKDKNAQVDFQDMPRVMGNETQLLQLFQNLIDNALKFIPDEKQPHIQIGATEQPEHFLFSISDNGIGIAPDMQAQIFTPFKKLHQRDEYRGTGIGLAICKKIVERHGGEIWVESDGKTGTTFWFTIGKEENN